MQNPSYNNQFIQLSKKEEQFCLLTSSLQETRQLANINTLWTMTDYRTRP
jgi:hypothetical protein